MPADGAFYLYVDIGDFTSDSLAFTKEMLDEIGVAATPGVDFDAERGSRYVRFCYAGTTADMAEAARRLKSWSRLQHAAAEAPRIAADVRLLARPRRADDCDLSAAWRRQCTRRQRLPLAASR